MPEAVVISGAVEGILDEAVIRRLVAYVGAKLGDTYGKNGKEHIRRRILGYNNAAQRSPWIVLVDLDRDAECAPPLRQDWLPNPAPYMCFRVAVREVEAWLLADRENIASFLHVPVSRIPVDPEALPDPKRAMINLALKSRRMAIQRDMVPRPGSGRNVGPAYASQLIEFALTCWNPEVARKSSKSLERAIRCLSRLVRSRQNSGRPRQPDIVPV